MGVMAAPKAKNLESGERDGEAFHYFFFRASLSFLLRRSHFFSLIFPSPLAQKTKQKKNSALVKRFRGHVASLLRHPTGAPVVDELYSRASQRDRDAMTAELYSKEYSVFAPGNSSSSSSLSQIPASLAGALEARGGDARARREMLSRVAALLVPLLEKAAVDPPIVHRVLAEYLENASDAAGLEVAQLLCGGGSGAGAPLLRVVHTRDGARAACRALAAVGAKERKGAVKAIKGHAAAMARDEWGHAVLATALTVVDDTALLAKAVVAELVAGGKDEGEEGGEEEGGQQQLPLLRELCSHPHASRVFCQLLSPCDPRVLPPHTLALVKAASDRALGEDGLGAGGGGDGGGGGGGKNDDGGEQDDGGTATAPAADAADAAAAASASSPSSAKSNLTSKKSAAKRRREILGSGSSPSSLGSALLRALAADASALLRTPAGADLVIEAARGGGRDAILLQGAAGQEQGQGHAEGVSKLHEAIVSAIEKGLHAEGGKKKKEKKDKKKEKEGEGEKKEEKKEDEEEEECLLTHFYASRALRRLVLCGGDSAGAFSSLLWERVLRGNCSRLCESHAAKVVAAVAVAGSAETREEIKGELRKCVAGGDVEAWAAGVLKPPPAKK